MIFEFGMHLMEALSVNFTVELNLLWILCIYENCTNSGPDDDIQLVRFSPDGSCFGCRSMSGLLKVFDIKSGNESGKGLMISFPAF